MFNKNVSGRIERLEYQVEFLQDLVIRLSKEIGYERSFLADPIIKRESEKCTLDDSTLLKIEYLSKFGE